MIKDKDGNCIHGYDCYLAFNRKYPEAKELYKKLAEDQKNNPSKNGVYTTQQRIFQISDFLAEKTPSIQRLIADPRLYSPEKEPYTSFLSYVNGMPMFSAWRNSLDIYKIDPEIFEEMIKSPIPKDTPCEVFKRLPNFCVYVEMPRPTKFNELLMGNLNHLDKSFIVNGFWAYLGIEPNLHGNKNIQLNICLDYSSDIVQGNFDFLSMVIKEGLTVEEATELVFKQYDGNIETAKQDQRALFALLPILLWLCAEQPDITNIKDEPVTHEQLQQPKGSIHKKTGLFVPPNSPTYYNLGKRLGGEIRQYQELIKQDEKDRPTASKRPHIRKGHWHGYWKGTTGNKVFTPKWLSAIFVGFN